MLTRHVSSAAGLIIVMTLLLGIAYPALVTGVGQSLFHAKAEGSLLYAGDSLMGSRLIGQSFSDPKYFWGRPSATSPQPYNVRASSGSNFGALNPALQEAVKANADKLRAADPGNTRPIPVELVSASGSGLDPDISPAAADFQAARVARARHLPLGTVQTLIQHQQHAPYMGIFGPPTVNVLEVNLALDRLR